MGKHSYAEKLHVKLKWLLMRLEIFQHFVVQIKRSIRNEASELEKNFPVTFMIEYHLPKKNRKVVNDHVVNFANGYPK